MPLYYFDINDGQSRISDIDGQDLPSFDAARQVAMEELSELLRDEVPDGDRASYVVTVRGAGREALYIATATMLCETLS